MGLDAYFWAAGVQTIAFVLRGRRSYPLQTWPRFLQLLHVLLYTTVIIFRASFRSSLPPFRADANKRLAIIVTAVFWSLFGAWIPFRPRYTSAFVLRNPWRCRR